MRMSVASPLEPCFHTEDKKSEMETREMEMAFQDRETLSPEPPVTTAAAGIQAEGSLQQSG